MSGVHELVPYTFGQLELSSPCSPKGDLTSQQCLAQGRDSWYEKGVGFSPCHSAAEEVAWSLAPLPWPMPLLALDIMGLGAGGARGKGTTPAPTSYCSPWSGLIPKNEGQGLGFSPLAPVWNAYCCHGGPT